LPKNESLGQTFIDQFENIDVNGDEELSADEVKSALARILWHQNEGRADDNETRE